MNRQGALNRAGFTLIEILIAVGLLSVIMLGMESMMQFSNRAVKSTSATVDFNSLITTLDGLFNNSSSCKAALSVYTLNAAIPPNEPLPQPIKVNGVQIVPNPTTGNGLIGNSLQVTQLAFTQLTSVPGVANQYLVTLNLDVNKLVGSGAGNAVGVQSLSHNFQIVVTTSGPLPSGITGCYGQTDAFWAAGSPPNQNDIYNTNTGNVGIGTTTPGTKLEVAGGIKPGGAATGASCAGNAEGSFGYDSTAHVPVYCSNTGNWTAMGGSPSGTICGFSGSDFNLVSNTWGGFTSLCQGLNPLVGCPIGYTRNTSYAYGQAGFNAAWCTKN